MIETVRQQVNTADRHRKSITLQVYCHTMSEMR